MVEKENIMTEYVIVGDTKNYIGCLVATCGINKEYANKILDRMINSPTENDKVLCKGHNNLRIEEIKSQDCWWNDSFLAN